MPRRGLPEAARMRHDSHYVDALAASTAAPIGQMVPIEQLDPNPDQPRQVMGDLSELMASIAEKGIIEPLVVRHRGDRFQIVAGERRYQAAVQIGVHEVPVVVRDVDDGELVEVALVENIQRKDLTPFEEADALQTLHDRFSHTHEELAKRLGKSRSSITELLSLNVLPESVKSLCRLAEITSKSTLLQIARMPDEASMIELVERITRAGGMTREELRKQPVPGPVGAGGKRSGRATPFVFKYAAPSKSYRVQVNFRKAEVEKAEVIEVLEELLAELRAD